LEGSPPLKSIGFNNIFLQNIAKVAHFCQWEVCGAATPNKLYFFKNWSPFPKETFVISPQDYFRIRSNIRFFFHSHCLGGPEPSEPDIEIAHECGLSSLIYSVPEKKFSFYDPKREKLIYFCL